MASVYILPDETVSGSIGSTGCGGVKHNCVNSGINSGAPTDGSFLSGQDDNQRFGFTIPDFEGTCTEIIVHFRGRNDGDNFDFNVTLYSDGSSSDGTEGVFVNSASYSNYAAPAYSIAKTAAQLTSVEVNMFLTSGSFDGYISEIEVEIVGVTLPGGNGGNGPDDPPRYSYQVEPVDPTNPLESVDVKLSTLPRTTIKRAKRVLFNIGEQHEDPKVLFKYFKNMAARYGDGFTVTRKQSGNLWSWGCSATAGQLGTSGTSPSSTPTQIAADVEFSRVIAPGKNHTIALDVSGAPYAWGDNTYGQLGDGTIIDKSIPTITLPSTAASTIFGYAAAGGGNHSLIINQDDGIVWAWGRNNKGQLGDGTSENNRSIPVAVGLGGGRKFRVIDAGDEHSIALDQRSKAWTWGSNASGQLGDGTITDSVYPTLPQNLPVPFVVYNWRDGIYSESLGGQDDLITNIVGVNACGWAAGTFPFVDGINEVPYSAPLVVSVEQFEFNIGSGDTNEYQAPSKGQNLDMCVPFMSGIQHVTATGDTDFDRDFCRILLENGLVRCSRGTTTGSQLKIGVFLVEFNPDRVKVQRGRIDEGGQGATISIDPVNMAKTFIYHSWRVEQANNVWRSAMVRARIINPSTVVIDRSDGSGDMDVGWWVVESLDDYGFVVETREWQHETSWSSVVYAPPLSAANADKMLTFCSWTSNVNSTNPIANIHCYFEPNDYEFKSLGGGTSSGRVCDIVGQAITFLDGTKSLGKWFSQYPSKKLDWTTNLTDWEKNTFPARSSGYEDYYGVNGNFSAIIQCNPQGLSRQSSGFLDSMQVFIDWGSGNPPGWAFGQDTNPYSWLQGSRGNNAGTLGWTMWDVISFDNFDAPDTGWTYRPTPPATKGNTFGALDGENSYFPNDGTPLSDIFVAGNFSTDVWGSGNFDFSYKTTFRTPPEGIGPSSQILFWYGDQSTNRAQIHAIFVRDTKQLYVGHNGDQEILATLDSETWYTLHVAYDSNTNTEKFWLDGEYVTQRILAGALNIAGGTATIAIMNHGWIGDNQFYGRMDDLILWQSDISEGQELIGGGSPSTIDTRFMDVAAGSLSSYGIDDDGLVWAWGDNTYGQLGDSSTIGKSIPVSVEGRHSFIQVVGGGRDTQGYACGLKPDGSVWCWGRNQYGQLGVCDETDRSTPTSVQGRHSFIDVWASKGGFQTIGLKADGSVWVWGNNPFCDSVNYCSPVSIPDFNLIEFSILGRGYFEDHANILEF